jgi:hypothetical protein
MGGWDTDSNGATVGSIMGTLIGAKKLPPKWIRPLHDQIRSSLKGFDNSKITTLARRTFKVAFANTNQMRLRKYGLRLLKTVSRLSF